MKPWKLSKADSEFFVRALLKAEGFHPCSENEKITIPDRLMLPCKKANPWWKRRPAPHKKLTQAQRIKLI